MFFIAGAYLDAPRGADRRRADGGDPGWPARQSDGPHPDLARPWASARLAASTRCSGCWRSGAGGLTGTRPRRQPRACPNAFNDFTLPGRRAGVRVPRCSVTVIVLFLVLAYAGNTHRARRAGHVRGVAGRRDHRLAVPAGVHQHRRRRHPGPDHRDHTAVLHQPGGLLADRQLRCEPEAFAGFRARGGVHAGNLERRCDC